MKTHDDAATPTGDDDQADSQAVRPMALTESTTGVVSVASDPAGSERINPVGLVRALMPMAAKLHVLGQKLSEQGKIQPLAGSSLSVSALDFVTARSGVNEPPPGGDPSEESVSGVGK